jgi:hypothetical protein
MIKRSTLIVLGVLVVLIIGYLLLQSNTAEDQPPELPTPTLQPTLRSLDDQDIVKITYAQIDLDEIVIERVDTLEWVSISHPEGSMTAGKIEELLSYLSDLQVMSQLPDPPPLEEIGLQEPVRAFLIEFDDGSVYSLKIGIPTPLNTGYYVLTENGEVIVLPMMNIDQAVNLLITATTPPTPTPDPENTPSLEETEIAPTPTPESE